MHFEKLVTFMDSLPEGGSCSLSRRKFGRLIVGAPPVGSTKSSKEERVFELIQFRF